MTHEIVSLENELLTAIYKGDKATMRQMMIPDGLGVDASFGYATQASLIDGIHNVHAVTWKMIDPQVIDASEDAKIVTYKLRQQATFKGRAEPSEVYATTVWVYRKDCWQALFHQETPSAA